MKGTRGHRRSRAVSAPLILGLAVVSGCAPTPQGPPGGGPATFTYTCCSAADIDQVLHPGDVLQLHWTATPGPSSRSAGPAAVTLSASLTGPYVDAATLKSSIGDGRPAPVWTASPVETTSQEGGAPVSTIAIPLDAAPGLYDLTSSVESGGGRLTGEHIVRIGPTAAS